MYKSQLLTVERCDTIDPDIQLFRQKLSPESVKVYATMPIGIMGSRNLALLD